MAIVAGLAAALALLGSSTSARAADAPTNDKEARRLFQRAELNFNVGKFAEALTDYQSAYEAKPLPGFLFNIAQCYRNMGDLEKARFFFRRYLALDPRAPNKRRVEELIDEITKQLEAKQAEAAAAPPAATAPPAAAAPGPDAAVTPVTPVAEAAPPPPAPSPPPATVSEAPMISVQAAPPPGERPVYKHWWFWLGAAVVVAGGATAAILLSRPETRAPGTLPPIDGRNP
jgi:tetratricopeptide (TPR) repeat protein